PHLPLPSSPTRRSSDLSPPATALIPFGAEHAGGTKNPVYRTGVRTRPESDHVAKGQVSPAVITAIVLRVPCQQPPEFVAILGCSGLLNNLIVGEIGVRTGSRRRRFHIGPQVPIELFESPLPVLDGGRCFAKVVSGDREIAAAIVDFDFSSAVGNPAFISWLSPLQEYFDP